MAHHHHKPPHHHHPDHHDDVIYPNYYWRDYTGSIPADAVPVDACAVNKKYIGQAFVKDQGLLIGEIFPGQIKITTNMDKINHTEVYNRILCCPDQSKLKWVQGDAKTLHTLHDTFVTGGTERNFLLFIGRIKYENEMKLGKVCAFIVEKAYMYYVHNNKEHSASSYEILTYAPKGC